MRSHLNRAAAKAKSNWGWIAMFCWIVWATSSIQEMKEDIADASNQAEFAANQAATRASSDELEDLKSTVEDLETTVANSR